MVQILLAYTRVVTGRWPLAVGSVGCRITVVNKNPTKCATTRTTKGTKLDIMLFRGRDLNKIYLGRKYVPAGALLCSTGACSKTHRTTGCTIDIPRMSFSLPGVVTHGRGMIHGLMLKIGKGLATRNIAVIDKRTAIASGGRIRYNKRACRYRGLLLYANSRAFIPTVPNVSGISC